MTPLGRITYVMEAKVREMKYQSLMFNRPTEKASEVHER